MKRAQDPGAEFPIAVALRSPPENGTTVGSSNPEEEERPRKRVRIQEGQGEGKALPMAEEGRMAPVRNGQSCEAHTVANNDPPTTAHVLSLVPPTTQYPEDPQEQAQQLYDERRVVEAAEKFLVSTLQHHNLNSQYKLAKMLETGCGGQLEPNLEAAAKFLDDAAARGYGKAYVRMAKMCLKRFPEEGVVEKAIELLQKGIDLGCVEAMEGLGELYRLEKYCHNPELAAKYFEKAKRVGSVIGTYHLAIMKDLGDGIPQDKGEALKLYKSAAEAGDIDALYNLAVTYQTEPMFLDKAEAARLYRIGAEKGDCGCIFNLGYMLDIGDGIEMNKEEAIKLYNQAASFGSPNAQYNLALIYGTGDGVQQDLKLAREYYSLAADKGHLDACFNLAIMCNKGEGGPVDTEEGLRRYLFAAKKGHVNSQYNLAQMYNHGIPIYKQKAVEWYQAAADQGHCKAMFALAVIHRKGILVPQNLEESDRLYRMAAKQGYPKAQYNLANTLVRRDSIEDKMKALKLFKRASDRGLRNASYNLGLMYYKGDGVAENNLEALRYFKLAVRRGHTCRDKVQTILEVKLNKEGFVY